MRGEVAGHFRTQTHLHSHWVVPVLCSQQLVLANLSASAHCRAAACESCPAAAGACLCLGARGNEGALDVAVALQGWGGRAWGETAVPLPQASPRPLTYGSEAATLDSFASHVLQTMVDGKESKRANARDARRGLACLPTTYLSLPPTHPKVPQACRNEKYHAINQPRPPWPAPRPA